MTSVVGRGLAGICGETLLISVRKSAAATQASALALGDVRFALRRCLPDVRRALTTCAGTRPVNTVSLRSSLLPRTPYSWLAGRPVWCDTSAAWRHLSTSPLSLVRRSASVQDKEDEVKEEKPSLLKRFKQMYKDYWYVLVPVHLVTSAVWFGSFYYASKSGLDIAGFLESWGFSEKITEKLRNSSAGHLAVAYALYKIATPARYTVTLGGTTYSIQFLSRRGYIKPVPSREQMKAMYADRREEFRERMADFRQRRRQWRERFQQRRKQGWRKKRGGNGSHD